MKFEEFQEKVSKLSFSRRQIAFKELQGITSSRYDYTIAYPDLFLDVTPEDLDMAYTIASVELERY